MKKEIIIASAGVLLTGAALTGLIGWQTEHQRVKELENMVADLERQEKRSAVDRSVSSQMEEIAFEQKIISDEQRENALQQTRVANEMRERSEVERPRRRAQRRSLGEESPRSLSPSRKPAAVGRAPAHSG